MPVARDALLRLSRSGAMKSTITRAPLTRGVVDRYVAGESTDDALRITRTLADANLTVTIDLWVRTPRRSSRPRRRLVPIGSC